jgi:hypothetical protein
MPLPFVDPAVLSWSDALSRGATVPGTGGSHAQLYCEHARERDADGVVLVLTESPPEAPHQGAEKGNASGQPQVELAAAKGPRD